MNDIVVGAMVGFLGALSIGMSIAFRGGRVRRLAFAYWDSTMPWYIRNVAFGLAPGGVVILVMLTAGLAASSNTLVGAGVSIALAIALGPMFLLVILWARRPPDFLKPDWLREEEGRRGGQPPATGVARWIDRAVLLIALLAVAGLLVSILLLVTYRP